jgi:hypothetical protein
VVGINESSYDYLKMFIWMLVTYLVGNYNFLSYLFVVKAWL